MDFDTFFIMTMFIPSSVFAFICVSQWLIICLCNKPVSDVLFIFVYCVLFFDCRMIGTYIYRISSCTQLSFILITQDPSTIFAAPSIIHLAWLMRVKQQKCILSTTLWPLFSDLKKIKNIQEPGTVLIHPL